MRCSGFVCVPKNRNGDSDGLTKKRETPRQIPCRRTQLYQVLYVVSATVSYLITVIQFLMFARAIISWLPVDEDSTIVNFLYAVTEPVIMPVRAVIERFGWFEGMPVDMSFFITFILLSIIDMII